MARKGRHERDCQADVTGYGAPGCPAEQVEYLAVEMVGDRDSPAPTVGGLGCRPWAR